MRISSECFSTWCHAWSSFGADRLFLLSCNWLGGHASVLAMDWYGNETLHNTQFTNMTIGGSPVAAIQNVDNFTFA